METKEGLQWYFGHPFSTYPIECKYECEDHVEGAWLFPTLNAEHGDIRPYHHYIARTRDFKHQRWFREPTLEESPSVIAIGDHWNNCCNLEPVHEPIRDRDNFDQVANLFDDSDTPSGHLSGQCSGVAKKKETLATLYRKRAVRRYRDKRQWRLKKMLERKLIRSLRTKGRARVAGRFVKMTDEERANAQCVVLDEAKRVHGIEPPTIPTKHKCRTRRALKRARCARKQTGKREPIPKKQSTRVDYSISDDKSDIVPFYTP